MKLNLLWMSCLWIVEKTNIIPFYVLFHYFIFPNLSSLRKHGIRQKWKYDKAMSCPYRIPYTKIWAVFIQGSGHADITIRATWKRAKSEFPPTF